jgi:hypothetical protein
MVVLPGWTLVACTRTMGALDMIVDMVRDTLLVHASVRVVVCVVKFFLCVVVERFATALITSERTRIEFQ